MKFFKLSHDSFASRDLPWVEEIVSGLEVVRECNRHGSEALRVVRPRGELTVRLDPDKGTRWPDVLGCGHRPLFIISGRVLDDWRDEGIVVPAARVHLTGPLPPELKAPPSYHWIDGEKLRGALLDFEASGYVDVNFCPECGARSDDVSSTHRRHGSGVWPMAFVPDSWNGAEVFTTDLASTAFFCTERVVEIAKRRRHTNFSFIPSEIAAGASRKSIKYLR